MNFNMKAYSNGQTLSVRLAILPVRAWLQALIPSAALVIGGLLAEWPLWLIALPVAILLGAVVYQIVSIRSVNRDGPVMTLDINGITVRNHPKVPWLSIDRVNVSSVGRGQSRVKRLLIGRRFGDVVAFVPKPNVEMPPPPGGGRDRARWVELRQRRFGTNLTVMTSIMDVSTEDLTSAAEHWGHVLIAHE